MGISASASVGIAGGFIPGGLTNGGVGAGAPTGKSNLLQNGGAADGIGDNSGPLAALAATLVATGGTIYFPAGVYRIGADTSIPASVSLEMAPGATISVDAGKTLTINSAVTSPAVRLFSGAGAVHLLGPALTIYPEWWGAVVDGADSTVAIQAALDAQFSSTRVRFKAAGDVGSLSAAVPRIVLGTGVYTVSATLNMSPYSVLEGVEGTYIKATSRAFDILAGAGNGYLARIKNIHFIGGRQQIVLNRANIDASMNVIEGCAHSSNDPAFFAVSITGASALNRISGARVLSCPRFLYASCDVIRVSDCWVNGYDETGFRPANTASYEFHSRAIMRDCIHVPENSGGGQAANGRWIDSYQSVDVKDCQFGTENGGFPIVYSFADSQTNTTVYPFTDGSVLSIRDCECGAGSAARVDRGVIVLRRGIPNGILLEGLTYVADSILVNAANMVDGVGAAQTLAAYLAAITDGNHPNFACHIRGIVGRSTAFIPPELAPYTHYQLTNLAAVSDEFLPSAHISELLGQVFSAVTGSGAGSQWVDTGVTAAAAPGRFATMSGLFLLALSVNPNSGGSASNRDAVFGLVNIGSAAGTLHITFTELGGQVITPDTVVTAVWWNGAAESNTCPAGSTANQIRIKMTAAVVPTAFKLSLIQL